MDALQCGRMQLVRAVAAEHSANVLDRVGSPQLAPQACAVEQLGSPAHPSPPSPSPSLRSFAHLPIWIPSPLGSHPRLDTPGGRDNSPPLQVAQPRLTQIRLGVLLPMFVQDGSDYSVPSWSPRVGVYQA